MNLIKRPGKDGVATIVIDNPDDLWALYKIIEPGDIVSGQTIRKVRIGDGSDEKSAKYAMRNVVLTITVEKTEYTADILRINGKITDGPEDIPRAEYHTFGIKEREQFSLKKPQWFTHHLKRLEGAIGGHSSILICLFDRDNAIIGMHSRSGFNQLTSLNGSSAKKGVPGSSASSFYIDLARVIADYATRVKPSSVICASALFWQQYLRHELQTYPQVSSKTTFAEIHSVDDAGLAELWKTKEFVNAAGSDSQPKQMALMEEVLRRIAKSEAATYGFAHVKEAVENGAVSHLLVSGLHIQQKKEDGRFDELESLLSLAENAGAQVVIVDEESPAVDKLDGLGGVVALLRYKVS